MATDGVEERLPAPPSSKDYTLKVLRKTDDLLAAMRFESILEELSQLPSSDATIQMRDHDKRVMSPVKTNVVETNAMLLALKDKIDLLHGKRFQCYITPEKITSRKSFIRTCACVKNCTLCGWKWNALRFTLAESPAKLSGKFPMQFPLNSVEDVQILNKQFEDRGLYLKMITDLNGNEGIFRRIMWTKSAEEQWVIAPET
ncbi:hypothetical protein EG68_04978 [Paragonimus skrjabini miyazakii]|uniref:Uncharacterized protein n=1 Tax=Paragonimus skrjabini miyazakii TaxID=59628 RepID=A0A8S9YQ69_9TREM|nr:hypothetical protein EG68_04978 [Paragonimus skrjabini miyazakii]